MKNFGWLLLLLLLAYPLVARPAPRSGPTLRVAGIPAPEDMVTVEEGTSYVVPSGKLFVATGISRDQVPLTADLAERISLIQVRFDSSPVVSAHVGAGQWGGNVGQFSNSNSISVLPGLVAREGVVISVIEETYNSTGVGSNPQPSAIKGVLYGYLYDPAIVSTQIEGIPVPSQMMRVVEGSTFTVPNGKRFVVTGAARDRRVKTSGPSGSTTTQSYIQVLFGGTTVASFIISPSDYWVTGTYAPAQAKCVQESPPGLVASGGTQVEVVERSWKHEGPTPPSLLATPAKGVLLGYLADG